MRDPEPASAQFASSREPSDGRENGLPEFDPYPGERIWFTRPRCLPGVEVMHARRSPRLWKVWHDTYTLCIAYEVSDAERGCSGGAFWRYRGRELMVEGGQVMLMEPGELHVTQRVVLAGSFDVFMVQPAIVEQLAAELGLRTPIHLREACTADPVLFCALEELASGIYLQHDPVVQQPRLLRVLTLLLQRFSERQAGTPPPLSRLQVRRACEFIEAHYAEPLNLDDLALACGVGKSSITHGLPKVLGLTPGELQSVRRVGEAKRLIASGLQAGDAAALVGFADQPKLTKHFKQLWGITPGRYARMIR